VAFSGVVLLPLTLQFLGAEGFGLVTFYIMIQAWIQLFDFGFSPAISKTVVQYRNRSLTWNEFYSIRRFYEYVFLLLLIFGSLSFYIFSDFISNTWLDYHILDKNEVDYVISILGLIAFLRLMSGIYRGVLTGSEKFVILSFINIFNVTGRFVVVLPFLYYYDSSISFYFNFQLTFAILELLALKYYSTKANVADESKDSKFFDVGAVKKSLMFSSSIAATSLIWIITSQMDKLLLSSYLTLSEYSTYGLVVVVSSCLRLVSGPFTTTLLPELASHFESGKNDEMIASYRKGTSFVMYLVIPITSILTFNGDYFIYLWTRDLELTKSIMEILPIYLNGTCLMILGSFPYYLQYASGKLKLHMFGSVIFLIIFLPLLFTLVFNYGSTGAAYAWLISNGILFSVWVPYLHYKLIPGCGLSWFKEKLLPIFLPSYAISLFLGFYLDLNIENKFHLFFYLCFLVFLTYVSVGFFVPEIRDLGRRLKLKLFS